MPKFKKTKPKPGKAKGTAIDSAQRELLERQNKLQAEIDALQRSIETEKAARPTLGQPRGGRGPGAGGAVPAGQYVHGVTMAEVRRATAASAGSTEWPRRRGPRRPAMLREERNAARRQTIALIVFLVGAVIYALSHLLPQ